ncbi:MAG: branched-chain-amino-acid transaminase [Nitrospiria bacterium]
MGTMVYLNGQFVTKEEAKISIFDHGYLFGDGIFETLRSYEGSIFKLNEHLERFFDSARYMSMTVPYSKIELQNLSYDLLKKSGLNDAYLRITLSRGIGERGIDPDQCKSPTLSIIAKDLPLYPQEYYSQGIPSMIVSIRKISDDSMSNRVKSCNYQNNILAKIELNRHKMIEGFLLNTQGFISEGTVSNVFIIKKGIILTPSMVSGCLEGITRNTVIDVAGKELGKNVQETQISRYDFYTADECFITNTLMELMPVISVDGRLIGRGLPGSITQELSHQFKHYVKRRSPS